MGYTSVALFFYQFWMLQFCQFRVKQLIKQGLISLLCIF